MTIDSQFLRLALCKYFEGQISYLKMIFASFSLARCATTKAQSLAQSYIYRRLSRTRKPRPIKTEIKTQVRFLGFLRFCLGFCEEISPSPLPIVYTRGSTNIDGNPDLLVWSFSEVAKSMPTSKSIV